MGDGIVLIQVDLYDVLNSIFLTLTDSFGNFYSLSETSAYMTVAVADYYQSGESHVTTTLNGLGYTLDGNNFII